MTARRMLERIGSVQPQVFATKLLADALSNLGEFDRSIALYTVACDRYAQLGDVEMVATIDMELGTVQGPAMSPRCAEARTTRGSRQFPGYHLPCRPQVADAVNLNRA